VCSSDLNNNNNNNNVEPYVNLWNTNNNQQQNQQTAAQQNQPVVQPQAAPQADPQEQLNQHIEGLNLTSGIDLSTLQSDIQEGNTESVMNALKAVAANSYKASMSDMQQMVQSQITAAVDTAVQKSQGNFESSTLVRDMHQKLEFTQAPEIEPMAKAVLAQFVKQGKSPTEAVTEVGKFFEHVGNKVAGTQNAPVNVPGANPYNQSNTDNDQDWDKLFSDLQ